MVLTKYGKEMWTDREDQILLMNLDRWRGAAGDTATQREIQIKLSAANSEQIRRTVAAIDTRASAMAHTLRAVRGIYSRYGTLSAVFPWLPEESEEPKISDDNDVENRVTRLENAIKAMYHEALG